MFPFFYASKWSMATPLTPTYSPQKEPLLSSMPTLEIHAEKEEKLVSFPYKRLSPWASDTTSTTTPPTTTGTTYTQARPTIALPVSFHPLFKMDSALNQRIFLWQGDILTLEIDAIVSTTNERLNDTDGLSGRILRLGKEELKHEYGRCERCPTGEVVVTSAPNLFAHQIIHAVAPRFTTAYANAADLTLHQCYKRALLAAKEHQCHSIAFPNLAVKKKGYPLDAATHCGLRTLRHCLEHSLFECIDAVILVTANLEEMDMYKQLLPLYFPRNEYEVALQQHRLPLDTFGTNEWGERLISNRCVRINASLTPPHNEVSKILKIEKEDMFPADFCSWQEDPDSRRRKREDSLPPEQRWEEQQEREYYAYLRLATDDESLVPELNSFEFLYVCGKDSSYQPIVAIIGNRFPASTVDPVRLMAYVIFSLHHLVQQPYTLLYVHTQSSYSNQPYLSWLRQFYYVFLRFYKKNLVRFLILHPSFLLYSLLYATTPMLTRKAAQKVHNVSRLAELQNYGIQSSSLQLPEFVREYDRLMFGTFVASKDDDENSNL